MNKKLGQDAIYDARELGIPRMLLLGLQHLFAMFGATVLVPILVSGYGLPLSIQTTLLFAGIGTLLFHVCTSCVAAWDAARRRVTVSCSATHRIRRRAAA